MLDLSMAPRYSRRSALRLGGIALTTVLAGCSLFDGSVDGDGSGGSPDDSPLTTIQATAPTSGGTRFAETSPDAGRESYGLVLRNVTDEARTVTLQVGKPFEETYVFEKTVTINANTRRSWDSVVTKNEEYAFIAQLPEVTIPKLATNPYADLSVTRWIEVGSDAHPPASDLIATVELVDVPLDQEAAETPVTDIKRVPSLRFNWPCQYMSPTEVPGGGEVDKEAPICDE